MKDLKEKLTKQLNQEIKNVMYGNLAAVPAVIETFINMTTNFVNIDKEVLHEVLRSNLGVDREADKHINKYLGE